MASKKRGNVLARKKGKRGAILSHGYVKMHLTHNKRIFNKKLPILLKLAQGSEIYFVKG